MTDLERIFLFEGAMAWVFEHCSDITAYTYALDQIGFTREQAEDELFFCDYGQDNAEQEIQDALCEVYGEL